VSVVTVRPIEDRLVQRARGNSRGMSDGGVVSYRLPDCVCASCGLSSRKEMHLECERDPVGRLLVVVDR
jgi:hypothetical protein